MAFSTYGREAWGRLDFNPSPVLGNPHEPCPFSELGGVVLSAWKKVLDLANPSVGPNEARVKRIDIARDFEGVERPAFFIRGLAEVPRAYARKSHVYTGSGQPLTLEVGSDSGSVRLYDKYVQTKHAVPKGRLRWEVEAKSWLPRLAGIRFLADVTEERLRSFAEDRWRWSRMGMRVAPVEPIIERVERMSMSEAKKSRFLGDLVRRGFGTEVRMSNDRAKEYRELLDELGLVPTPEMFGGRALDFSRRLDFESGTELAEAV